MRTCRSSNRAKYQMSAVTTVQQAVKNKKKGLTRQRVNLSERRQKEDHPFLTHSAPAFAFFACFLSRPLSVSESVLGSRFACSLQRFGLNLVRARTNRVPAMTGPNLVDCVGKLT